MGLGPGVIQRVYTAWWPQNTYTEFVDMIPIDLMYYRLLFDFYQISSVLSIIGVILYLLTLDFKILGIPLGGSERRVSILPNQKIL